MRRDEAYERDGYLFPLRVLSRTEARRCRNELEAIEARCGDDAALRRLAIGHANALLPFADRLTRRPEVLTPVTAILGPDVLVWNASFFIKEPRTADFISWHQDLTYWGLDEAQEVTAWIALSDSTVASGCVRFVPGSHTERLVPHRDTFDENNLLSRGQEIAVEVDESAAVDAVLAAGEMSLHHGRMFHGSNPNGSGDRRIGLAIRYITPAMKQRGGERTHVRLVAGEDRFGHFTRREPPRDTLHPDDIAAVRENIALNERFLFADAAP